MSGSPILNEDGAAIELVASSMFHPRLASNLPVGLLKKMGNVYHEKTHKKLPPVCLCPRCAPKTAIIFGINLISLICEGNQVIEVARPRGVEPLFPE